MDVTDHIVDFHTSDEKEKILVDWQPFRLVCFQNSEVVSFEVGSPFINYNIRFSLSLVGHDGELLEICSERDISGPGPLGRFSKRTLDPKFITRGTIHIRCRVTDKPEEKAVPRPGSPWMSGLRNEIERIESRQLCDFILVKKL